MDPILLPVGLLMAIYTRSVKMNEILIVDDDRTVCRCLERLINWEALGYNKPRIAYNGTEAMKWIESGFVPNVVLTDIRMPLMNGVMLAEKIREQYPNIQIVFFSAYEDFEAAQAGIQYGVKRYIMKPINRESLRNVEQTLQAIAVELKTEDQYRKLLQKGDEKTEVFNHLYRKDVEYFQQLFDEFQNFTSEQAHSIAILFLNVLTEFAAHKAGPEYADRLHGLPRKPADSEKMSSAEWGKYLLSIYTSFCSENLQHFDNKAEALVEKIRQCILQQYENADLNVAWIARQLNYTPNYISRVFCEQTGIPISACIIQMRMDKAIELLCHSEMSIAEIAQKVGYPNANYFAKAFHKYTGTSPTDYRKKFS